jgi:uncharacterized DUF497 family protein
MRFEWDSAKAQSNVEKHEVAFDEACTVFSDEISLTVSDPDHSADEERAIIFGESASGLHLVVSFTERGDIIRIISARQMTPRERRAYEH